MFCKLLKRTCKTFNYTGIYMQTFTAPRATRFNDDTANYSALRNAFIQATADAIWDIFVNGNLGGWNTSDCMQAAMLYAFAQDYVYTENDEAQGFLQDAHKLIDIIDYEISVNCEDADMHKFITRIFGESLRFTD